MYNIGTITFHNAHNYGAVLQAYALQKKLKDMGYNNKIINYHNRKIENQYKLIKYSKKNPIKGCKLLYKSLKFYNLNKKRYENFENFILNELDLTQEYKTIKELKNNPPNMDCYITGSDQVWNIDIVGEISEAYTLNFGNNKIKRLSYAASIGDITQIKNNETEYINKISKINSISVREIDAKDELQKIINKNVKVVLDPTLLLSKEEWNKKVENNYKEKEKYILAYVVKADKEYIKIVNDLSNKTGLKVIHFELENPDYKNILKSAYTEGPLEFVNYIKNAEYVVSTSFHATIFSIIFNKKFFIIPHRKTGSRVTNLLDKLGIENRIFYSLDEFLNVDYKFETNWKEVNNKIEKEREKSINWLKKAIEG